MKFNYTYFFAFLLLGSAACRKSGTEKDTSFLNDKPNIILILADDIGYEVLRCNGGESYFTPAIDNLANKGVRFTQCHACPNCCPTRVEMLTGKYGFRNYTGWGNLDNAQKTIANMLKDEGYKTCVAGKWQLGGGDASIHGFGFDDYLVFEPFFVQEEFEINKYRYKSPKLYEDGNFLPENAITGKYADDMFAAYISDFIDKNSNAPFFVYFSLSLCHSPFSPTPDDPEYAAWDPSAARSDTRFFPSMVKYMDKKVQQIIDKVESAGLISKTIIIFMGDNGTPVQISSVFNGQTIVGGKSSSTVFGTHVPLIVNWPGNIQGAKTNATLIDPSDFLPTVAEMAKIIKPANYGILDGISFYPLLYGSADKLRDWIYCYWNPQHLDPISRNWVQDETYKLYDSTNDHLFFNILNDPYEIAPVTNNELSPEETAIKNKFDSVLKEMHK